MKKTLLFIAIASLTAFVANAQTTTVWNFGGDATNFPVFSGLATGATSSDPGATETIQGLTISAGLATSATTGTVSASTKSFTDANSTTFSFINKFLLNGSGYSGATAADIIPSVNMPTQRYASFQVTGNSTIYAIGVTGSNGSARNLFVTDGTNLIGTMAFPSSSAALVDASVTYTGPATTLYLFGNASVVLYYLSATNVNLTITAVNQVPSDKGVSFNGTEILNSKGIALEVYNLLGKKVASSITSIPTTNFQKGVYVIRIAGSNDSLKICI